MSRPTLIPRLSLEQIPQSSERQVAKALLETLDQDWVVFHSYSWLRSRLQRSKAYLKEGEADFVLLHPKYGLLVLEVKGGEILYDVETGLWQQNHHSMKDPFKQAQTNMHALLEQVRDRAAAVCGGGLPFAFGYAVVLPSCNFDGHLPPGAHPSILFGARDLPELGRRIEAALRHWSPSSTKGMAAAEFKAVKGALVGSFRPVVATSGKISEDEEILVRLTEDQTEQLSGLLENQRAAVEGVAGSGKTLLALLRAETFAAEGKQTLFLCYNKKLAEVLALRVAGIANLAVTSFHRLCHDLCLEAGLVFEVPAGVAESTRFWSDDAPELMVEALERKPEIRYDALVVDEAQDFQALWWLALEKLCREPGGPMYIFYDRSQNLFGNSLDFPIHQPLYKLKTNCRNTKSIAAGCANAIGSPIRTLSFSPQGEAPEVRVVESAEQARGECEDLLNLYVGRDGLSVSKLAILSTKRREKSCLSGEKLGKHVLTEDLGEWQAGRGVCFSTVKGFKGLEADVVILIEAGEFHPTFFSRQDLYVAASRAKHRLHVLTTSKEVATALLSAQVALEG